MFFGLPAVYWLGLVPLAKIPFLLLIVTAVGAVLAFDAGFDRRVLWNAAPLRSELPRILGGFAVGAAGVLFAWTYERTRSTLAVSVEHALFGCWMFTVGLGSFFS